MMYVPAGFGNAASLKRLLNMLDNGLKLEAIVVYGGTMRSDRYRGLRTLEKIASKDVLIYTDITLPKDPLKIVEKLGDVTTAFIVNKPIEVLPDDRQIVAYGCCSDYSPYYGVWFKMDNVNEANEVSLSLRNKGAARTFMYHYNIVRHYPEVNADYVISANWTFPTNYNSFYIERKGKLVNLSINDLNEEEWKIFVSGNRDLIEKYGLDYNKIVSLKRITWDHNFFTLLYILGWLTGNTIKARLMSIPVSEFGCYNCALKHRCPYYEENYTGCHIIEKKLQNINSEDMFSILEGIIREKYLRYLRGRIFEDLEGGMLDKHVTTLEDSLARLVELYLKLKNPDEYGSGRRKRNDDEDEFIEELKSELKTVLGVLNE